MIVTLDDNDKYILNILLPYKASIEYAMLSIFEDCQKLSPFSVQKNTPILALFSTGGGTRFRGGGRRFFPSSFATVHDFFLDFLQIKKRIQKNQYKEQEKMEEKIVYRPKNRRWFFYTSARKKSSPPPP